VFAWLKQINRLVIWNGLAVVTWIWALPFYFRNRERVPLASAQAVFLFIWLVPGLIVQALIHIGAPGHTLFSVAALCILGGYVLSLARARDMALSAALVLNAMLFLDFLNLPAGVTNSAEGTPSMKNAMLFGTFETSIGQVRWMDDVARITLSEIEQFTPKDRPSMIVSTDTYVSQWFMNWRIGRYYLPDRDLWVLYKAGNTNGLQRVRRDVILDKLENVSINVPIFTNGRILWLIEPNSDFHRNLTARYQVNGGRYVFYTDVVDSTPIIVEGVEFVPRPFGFLSTKATANPGH
jgi:hypothetical protein